MSYQLFIFSNDTEFKNRAVPQLSKLAQLTIKTGSCLLEATTTPYSLFLADLDGSGESGVSLIREIRTAHIGCYSILARLSTDSGLETVLAYDAGADDCFTKATELVVIEAKVRSAIARTQRWLLHQQHNDSTTSLVEGLDANLTRIEQRLLRVLTAHPGQTVATATLLREIWGHARIEPKLLYEHVSSLRSKLRAKGWSVTNERGKGYRLCRGDDVNSSKLTAPDLETSSPLSGLG